nr:exportin [Dugesia japonica]
MSPMAINENTASQLLDFNQKLDISLLDAVVDCMYTGTGTEQKMAEKILTTLKEHPDAWIRVDSILECSNNQQTKYYALQILENVIKCKWKVLPRVQCEGIKKYIVGLIIKTSSNMQMLENEKVYLGKLNMILVQILKHEWPKNWPTFIQDIVGSSRSNEALCQNNMVIMKLLSEEVFDFSLGQMTQTKIKHLKDSMCSEFSHIFQLCQYVLFHSQNAMLVVSTLETLLKFMHWIPLGYIFETNLNQTLITKFLNVPMFRNVTLQCLTEMANVSGSEYANVFIDIFENTTHILKEMLAPQTNIKEAYMYGQDDEQKFIQNMSLFYSSLFMNHLQLIESKDNLRTHLVDAFEYMLNISEVEETEIFKICLELWNYIVSDLYRQNQELNYNMNQHNIDIAERNKFYHPILSRLRKIMISRMARPEEVLVVENEQGEVVREFMKDTDSINLYKNMRECLVYLTHLDYHDTDLIMTEKLGRQMDGTEWSWKNLNTLCWAIGSISGSMHEDDERRFLVVAIRDLLSLCEQKRGKDNKAIVASNIMYVVGQYPRFLKAHWRFLKTVITKLFEFMHETHDGVQDMACDTFIKIAVKCRRQFVTLQSGEMYTFVDEILGGINNIISDLHPQQVHTFYEAMGMVVAAETDTSTQTELINKLFYLPNQVWDDIISQAHEKIEILQNPDVVKQIVNILKTNYSACKSLGASYVQQLSHIYMDMLNVYKVISENINIAVTNHGEQVAKQPVIRAMRAVKKEALKIISSWVQKSVDPAMVAENFIPPMLDAILFDYQRNIAPAREPEVLSSIATIINRLHQHINEHIPTILDAVFECTLSMINKDMEEYPEHRTNFFTLLEAVNQKSFIAFTVLPAEKFKLLLDSIIWAVKHTMRQVSEIGLNILSILLQNVNNIMEDDAKQIFYKNFFMEVLHHMFSVVTDSSHAGNLTLQCTILSYMFKCLEDGKITINLSISQNGPLLASPQDNVLYVQNSLAALLKQAFPQLQDPQIKVFIEGLFSFDQDLCRFRENMRDFLVQIREFAGDDLSDLFLEEKETEIKQAQEEKQRIKASVPGILNPHEITEDMID